MAKEKLEQKYNNFYCLKDHSLVAHKLTLLRDKNTAPKEFREVLEEVTFILAADAARHIQATKKMIETPLATFDGVRINPTTIIPIIRAGIGMINPLLKLLPDTKLGFMGLSRNHDTLKPFEYYMNIPKICENTTVFVLDPMLATGNTMEYTLNYLKQGVYKQIIVLSILVTPHALELIFKTIPDIIVYAAGIDTELNSKGYIIPGLGDAGDRIFNTL